MSIQQTDIIIEVLYPEIANLYGETLNVRYLNQCLPDASFYKTSLMDTPRFVSGQATMVYMGAMTEYHQSLAIEKLMPYREHLIAQIDKGTIFLFTGNAMELFGQYIENDDGSRIHGLGIFPIYAKRQMMKRHNSRILGEFEGIKLIGFKSQFSHSYGDNSELYFYKALRGSGIHLNSKLEGVWKNHFFGTYALGPFLVNNPFFTKYLMTLMGIEHPTLAFEEASMEAYNKRLAEFEDKNTQF